MVRKLENNNDKRNFSQTTNHSVQRIPQFFPINTFDISSCLFWAAILAYLSNLKSSDKASDEDDDVYHVRFHAACKMIADISIGEENKLKSLIRQFYKTQDLTFIYRSPIFQSLVALFRQRVVDYMEQKREHFQGLIKGDFANYLQSMRLANRFGSETEIQAIMALLQCNIEVLDIKTHEKILYQFLENQILTPLIQNDESLIQIRTLYLFNDPDTLYYHFTLEENLNLVDAHLLSPIPTEKLPEENVPVLLSDLILVDVPADNSCLFWATALAYLASLDDNQFLEGWNKLFCFQYESFEQVKKKIKNLSTQNLKIIAEKTSFSRLIRGIFRQRVVEYMNLHRNDFMFETADIDDYIQEMFDPDVWGGWEELKAISRFLQCKILLFPSWDKGLKEPVIYGTGLPTLYLFYDNKKRHYYFGRLKTVKIVEQYASERQNSDNKENSTYVRTTQKVSSEKARKRNFLTISNEVEELPVSESLTIQRLFNSVLEGIAVGIFLETVFLILPASPLAKLLSISTQLDSFLTEFLEIKKPFTIGILGGSVGALIKTILDMDNGYQILPVMVAIFSILPIENEKIEKMQFLIKGILMCCLLGKGLVNTVNFSLPYLTKILEMLRSFSIKIIPTIAPASFFAKKEIENTKNKVMDEGAYVQLGTRVFH